jgi:pyruvate dehydrogenase E2 component (dihydrolipoamide acetyltransferase)
MADFVMPILGSDMEAGTLVAWRKQPGDRLERGDIIAEVETEKGLIEVEVFTSGTLERLLVQPGAKVPVGTVLATIREEAGAAAAGPPLPAVPPAPGPPQSAVTPFSVPPPAIPPPAAQARLRISPAARARAAELGIDPATLPGTGPQGVITLQDVERAGKPAAPADRHARMRQAIAAAMVRSKREIPHFYLASTIDLEPALVWLETENAQRPVTERLLAGVLFLKAVALALREVPELNARWEGGRVVPGTTIHVGAATALRGGGLVAPALHDTDRMSLADLMRAFRDVVQRARAGTLRSSELSDPTFTVTSLGDQGTEMVFPVIYPPQVAIVGFGRIVGRPWVVDGALVARRVVGVTLAADHRVTDGHRAGRFVGALDRLLQEPARL